MAIRWVLLLVFVVAVANFECGRWSGVEEGRAVANEWADLYGQSVSACSKEMNDLGAEYCRAHVTGCRYFDGLIRRGDGVYECRCR